MQPATTTASSLSHSGEIALATHLARTIAEDPGLTAHVTQRVMSLALLSASGESNFHVGGSTFASRVSGARTSTVSTDIMLPSGKWEFLAEIGLELMRGDYAEDGDTVRREQWLALRFGNVIIDHPEVVPALMDWNRKNSDPGALDSTTMDAISRLARQIHIIGARRHASMVAEQTSNDSDAPPHQLSGPEALLAAQIAWKIIFDETGERGGNYSGWSQMAFIAAKTGEIEAGPAPLAVKEGDSIPEGWEVDRHDIARVHRNAQQWCVDARREIGATHALIAQAEQVMEVDDRIIAEREAAAGKAGGKGPEEDAEPTLTPAAREIIETWIASTQRTEIPKLEERLAQIARLPGFLAPVVDDRQQVKYSHLLGHWRWYNLYSTQVRILSLQRTIDRFVIDALLNPRYQQETPLINNTWRYLNGLIQEIPFENIEDAEETDLRCNGVMIEFDRVSGQIEERVRA